MFSISEFELYNSDGFLASQEDFEFYRDSCLSARSSFTGILIGVIVPDSDCGHVDFHSFDTWTDVRIWLNQN